MKKLLSLTLGTLMLAPLINASEKEELITEKPIATQQELLVDNLYKSGLIKRMVKEDLKDLKESNDEKFKEKSPRAILTIETLSYQIAKYLGAYMSAMNGLDAIIFTGFNAR